MPYAPKRPCAYVGCPELVERGETHCDEHKQETSRGERLRKGSAWAQGYNTAWERVRQRALKRDNYVCQECLKNYRYVPAEHVDHVVPFHGKNDPLRLLLSNLRSLCRSCHSRKTALEDGGFGNAKVNH
jgi:5-methylcytosine-specific restriction protein A